MNTNFRLYLYCHTIHKYTEYTANQEIEDSFTSSFQIF